MSDSLINSVNSKEKLSFIYGLYLIVCLHYLKPLYVEQIM